MSRTGSQPGPSAESPRPPPGASDQCGDRPRGRLQPGRESQAPRPRAACVPTTRCQLSPPWTRRGGALALCPDGSPVSGLRPRPRLRPAPRNLSPLTAAGQAPRSLRTPSRVPAAQRASQGQLLRTAEPGSCQGLELGRAERCAVRGPLRGSSWWRGRCQAGGRGPTQERADPTGPAALRPMPAGLPVLPPGPRRLCSRERGPCPGPWRSGQAAGAASRPHREKGGARGGRAGACIRAPARESRAGCSGRATGAPCAGPEGSRPFLRPLSPRKPRARSHTAPLRLSESALPHAGTSSAGRAPDTAGTAPPRQQGPVGGSRGGVLLGTRAA